MTRPRILIGIMSWYDHILYNHILYIIFNMYFVIHIVICLYKYVIIFYMITL